MCLLFFAVRVWWFEANTRLEWTALCGPIRPRPGPAWSQDYTTRAIVQGKILMRVIVSGEKKKRWIYVKVKIDIHNLPRENCGKSYDTQIIILELKSSIPLITWYNCCKRRDASKFTFRTPRKKMEKRKWEEVLISTFLFQCQ